MSKIAFLFAGQGAQYVGMGKDIAESQPISREVFNQANEALGFDITTMCFEGPKEALDQTENTQPAILTTTIAIVKAVMDKGVQPDIVAGLSLGEYSALVCNGVLEFDTAVQLVKKRGKYMQEAVPAGVGTMAAILGLDPEHVKAVCKEASEAGVVEPANFNCPGQIVIAGEVKAVEVACEKAKEAGARRAMMLSVSGPFHTSMLKPAAEQLERELEATTFGEIKIPYITNVTAEYVTDQTNIKSLLKQQVMSAVLWEDTIRKMIQDGVDTFIEIGPGKVLSGFVKKVDRKLTVMNVEDTATLEKAIDALS